MRRDEALEERNERRYGTAWSFRVGPGVVLGLSATPRRTVDGPDSGARRRWGARAAQCDRPRSRSISKFILPHLSVRRGGGARTRLMAQRTSRLGDPFGGSFVELRGRVSIQSSPGSPKFDVVAREMRAMARELELRGQRRARLVIPLRPHERTVDGFSQRGRWGWGAHGALR